MTKRQCPGTDYFINRKKYMAGEEPAKIICYCGEEFNEETFEQHVIERYE